MAEAILAEVVSVIANKLSSQIYTGIMSVRDQNTHIKRLQELKTVVEATLLDADSMESCSNAQRDVLEKLSCALAELDDFLDEEAARAKKKQAIKGNKFIKSVRLFFSESNQFFSPLKDAHKLKTIVEKFECIAKHHAQFGAIVSTSSVSQTRGLMRSKSASSHVISDVVIGRDGDRDNIISMLSDSVSCDTLSVASIVGIGGMGKTTLAQYVYHDERVKNCFDVQFWVSTTEDFDVKLVLEKILGVVTSTDDSPLNGEMDQLYDRFLKAISGKKFLLVLDDIWDQDGLRLKWLKLRRLLEFGASGSRVLITTRFQTVAGIMDSVGPYTLEDLTEHDSWLLFRTIAFTQWQELGVESIGQEIAKMCPNVPLAVRIIGGVLSSKHTVQEWQAFRDDQLANFSLYGHDIMKTLKFSYDQLDGRLKLCVAYCSLFPKRFQYDIDEMIRLWISLGYVEPQYSNQSLEEAGVGYMRGLVNCGFFTIAYIDDQNSCRGGLKMHDLMHDLIMSIAGFKYKIAYSNTDDFDERVRHVSFSTKLGTSEGISQEVPLSLFKIKHLQSLLLAECWDCRWTLETLSTNDRLFLRMRWLRVLDLHQLGIKNVPPSLGELVCLRYLNLSHNPMTKLPKSITQLVNLLSFDLSRCDKLQELPKGTSKLVKLRHLRVKGCEVLSHMPKGLGNLTDLQTLDTFILREQNSQDRANPTAVGRLAELNRLHNLTGALHIRVFGRSKDTVHGDKATNLQNLYKLTSLLLEFNDGSTKDDEMMIEGLQPNAHLRRFHIYGYRGESLPSWVRDQLHLWLPNLVEIVISNCEGCKCLCSFGKLPYLELLILDKLMNLEYIEEVSGGTNANDDIKDEFHTILFPSLQRLVLRAMPKLKGWHRISDCEKHPRQAAQNNNLLQPKHAFPKMNLMQIDKIDWLTSMIREFRGMSSLSYLYIGIDEDLTIIPLCSANFPNGYQIFRSR